MSKYQEQHYEDIASFIADMLRCRFGVPGGIGAYEAADYFAALFAADNPPMCNLPDGHDGECNQKGEGGFDREWFLKACGLES